jgi:hypothetical protein
MRLVATLAVLGTFACGSAPVATSPNFFPGVDYVYLTTDASNYRPGDQVTLLLMNPSQRQYGYNLCPSRLEHLQEGDWVVVRRSLAEFCTMELRLLDPGQRGSYAFEMDASAPEGQYRVQTSLEDIQSGERMFLTSTTFAVTRASTSPDNE